MADVTVKQWDEFEGNYGGAFKLIRHGLGVTSFGLNAIDLPPNVDQYPEHDHANDGQEEVYTVLNGKATLQAGGEEYELTPGTFARVPSGVNRKIVTKDEGCRLLAIGGKPGDVYEIPEMSTPQQAPA